MPWMPAPRTTTTLTGIIRTRMDMVARKRLKLRMKKIPKPSPSASPAIATMTPRPFKGGPLRYLITGGAGFIGSHLAERLLDRGDRVVLLDNLSTGSVDNIRHLKSSGRMQYHLDNIENRQLLAEQLLDRGDRVVLLDNLSTGSVDNIRHLKSSGRMQYHLDNIENRQLLAELVDDADVIVHLAAAVGVKLIVESPVRTIETNVNGTQLILETACKKRKLVLTASTSEVYGKNTNVPFHEDADLVLGPTTKGRWSYAASKALDEFLALSYWKEKKLPVIVARLFNTVGPRQTGRY